ncbi:hypothetical protein E2C01_026649 [Portunus trituberculatus]|uniref:Uncharacterized protein n=1 Tax=Portunus trituberculatus TaxID=210409 RepID=A0A5B7EIR2_PORTR|nr:hypothetical protein [Portunus trituberculatus]
MSRIKDGMGAWKGVGRGVKEKSTRDDASHFSLDVQEGVGPVMLHFLQLYCLEASQALFRGGSVAGTTKQTVVLPDTPVSVMEATAFPAAGTPIAGNVAVAKQETAGAAHDWEGVGPNMVDHVFYGHFFREGPTKFKAYGHVRDCLFIPVIVWEA